MEGIIALVYPVIPSAVAAARSAAATESKDLCQACVIKKSCEAFAQLTNENSLTHSVGNGLTGILRLRCRRFATATSLRRTKLYGHGRALDNFLYDLLRLFGLFQRG